MTSFFPTARMASDLRLFAAASSATVMPCLRATTQRLSRGTTVWVVTGWTSVTGADCSADAVGVFGRVGL
jgi:hypothetical protein